MSAQGPPLAFEAFGLVGTVATELPEPVESLVRALPPGWSPAPGRDPAVGFELRGDGSIAVDGDLVSPPNPECETALDALSHAIRHHLAEHAPEHVFIHAGTVAVGDVAVLIPGRSLSGKTTLVAALVGLGAIYYSDEYAVVDTAGRIHPYPRPLTLRWDFRANRAQVPVAVPSDRIGVRPIRAGLILVTRHRPDASWRPSPAGAGAGGLALIDNAVAARRRAAAVLAAARQLTSDASVLVGDRGDAGPTALRIMSILERRPDRPAGLARATP